MTDQIKTHAFLYFRCSRDKDSSFCELTFVCPLTKAWEKKKNLRPAGQLPTGRKPSEVGYISHLFTNTSFLEQSSHKTSGMQSTLADKPGPTPPSISQDTLIQECRQVHPII